MPGTNSNNDDTDNIVRLKWQIYECAWSSEARTNDDSDVILKETKMKKRTK